jgi:hypothetical protein
MVIAATPPGGTAPGVRGWVYRAAAGLPLTASAW